MRVWRRTTGSTFIRSGIKGSVSKCNSHVIVAAQPGSEERREDACALQKLARNETSAACGLRTKCFGVRCVLGSLSKMKFGKQF